MVVVGRIGGVTEFLQFLKELDVKGMFYVVKPDWANAEIFTDAQTLDWLFSGLEGKVKLVEAYTLKRNHPEVKQESQDPAISNPRARWQWFKDQEKRFLESTGIDQILKKHGVEYINVTEEVWSMKTLRSDEVRSFVDSQYGILVSQEFYDFVPTRIYELRGATFISLCRSRQVENQVSLSTKNPFGLIPDPDRDKKWSGRNRRRLSQSIIDINKIYRSLFSPSYWINEVRELGVFIGGRNSVETDAVTAKLTGVNPDEIDYLKHAANVFGGYDKKILENTADLI